MIRTFALVACLTSGLTLAQTVPTSISFNARLADTAGAPIAGSHTLSFGLYDQPTGGAAAWTESIAGASFSTEGLVFAELGATTPLNPTVLDGRKLYLEVRIDSTTMSPRLAILSVPYAIRASVAATALSVGALTESTIQRRVMGTCPAGQAVRSIDASGNVQCESLASGTVSAVTGVGPISVATGTTTPVISVALGTTAGTVAAGDDSRFGMLSGRNVAATAPATGQVLGWNGTAWAPTALPGGYPTSPRVLMGTGFSACLPDYGGANLGAQNFGYGFIEFPANFPGTPSMVVGIDESLNNSGPSWARVRRGPFANRVGVRCDYVGNALHWFAMEQGSFVVDGKRMASGRLANATTTTTVFFTTPFTAPPVVLAMIDESGDDNGAVTTRVYNVTANGFQIFVNSPSDGLYWVALDPGTYQHGRYRFVAASQPTGGCNTNCPVALSGFTTAPGVVMTILDTDNNGASAQRLLNLGPGSFNFSTYNEAAASATSEFLNYIAFEEAR